MQSTWVYIDGFNLFYNSLKHTQYRWLDLKKLCEQILEPHNRVDRIKYFTARVVDRFGTDCAKDQQTYFDALATIPEVEIILGNFTSHIVQMPLAYPKKNKRFSDVIKTDEKGSDVNLASHLLNDAWKKAFDVAVVISNDSDLATPISMVLKDHKKTVGIIYPTDTLAYTLKNIPPSFKRKITPAHLKAAQLPLTITGKSPILCPNGWDVENTAKLKALRERNTNNKKISGIAKESIKTISSPKTAMAEALAKAVNKKPLP